MSDAQRELLDLRTIATTTRVELRRPNSLEHRAWILDRADALLAELEARVMRGSAERAVLDAVERERRALEAEQGMSSTGT